MNNVIENRNGPQSETDQRGMSQAVFVAVALAITLGCVWSLYMGDAPYHPEVTQSDAGMIIASE